MIRCNLRYAEEKDLTFLTDLYNFYIAHTAVTFDTEPLSIENRRTWLNEHAPETPWNICIAEDSHGFQLGFTASHPFRMKPGYATSVETSIYIKPGLERQGIGKQLYGYLFSLLAAKEVHRAYVFIALPNESSEALHSWFGFRAIGTFSEVGRKFGSYIDVLCMEKQFQ